jgi:hypothetical protein
VRHGETGLLLRGAEPAAIVAAVRAVRERDWDATRCRAGAERFAEEQFVAELEDVLEQQLDGHVAPSARATVQLAS